MIGEQSGEATGYRRLTADVKRTPSEAARGNHQLHGHADVAAGA